MLSSLILLPQNHLATATNFLPFSEHAFWGLFLLAVTKLLTNSWVVWSFSSSSCMAVIRLHVIIKQTWEESHSNIHKNIPAQLDVTSEEFLVSAIWKKRWNLRRNIGRYMSEKNYGKNGKYSLIRALQISWSRFSQELAGIATLLAQSMRGLAQYTIVMSHSHVKLHLKMLKAYKYQCI